MTQYFMSVNNGKRLSHVIGKEHKLMVGAENKRHLLILKLIRVCVCFLLLLLSVFFFVEDYCGLVVFCCADTVFGSRSRWSIVYWT